MADVDLLQAVRLKGRASVADLAATLKVDGAAIAAGVAALVESGLVIADDTVRISSAGRERLATLLAAERSGLDHSAMMAAYREFRSVNRDFKVLVTDWQIRDDQPNTHQDDAYDAQILRRLGAIHERVLPVVASAAAVLPRLAPYGEKLSASLAKIRAGETIWFTRPLIDSYHTVWFELYEEVILAVGLTRKDEAIAGYAH